METLTPTSFAKLLERLDDDSTKAAKRYEELRLKLARCFIWRGCASSAVDALVDQTLDRIATKLVQGVEIENLNAYAATVSRYVWFEHQRKHKEDAFGDELPVKSYQPDFVDESDDRLRCLRKCLGEVASDAADRQLIIGYYDTDEGAKIKDQRKSLAEKLGMTMINLKVKACRLRSRLESCINDCVGKKV